MIKKLICIIWGHSFFVISKQPKFFTSDIIIRTISLFCVRCGKAAERQKITEPKENEIVTLYEEIL